MDSPPPPLPAKTRHSSTAPVIVSATRHSRPHVVKIRVNSGPPAPATPVPHSGANTVRINITNGELEELNMRGSSPYYFYTSGQSSPSDTLDSGTCSDLEHGSTPPPLPKKGGVTVTVHQRGGSLTSSGADAESDDEISCDSLNSSELDGSTGSKPEEIVREDPIVLKENRHHTHQQSIEEIGEITSRVSISEEEIHKPLTTKVSNESSSSRKSTAEEPHKPLSKKVSNESTSSRRSVVEEPHKPLSKKVSNESTSSRMSVVEERTYENRNKPADADELNPDSFYKFHLNENCFEPEVASARKDDEDYFAGCKGFQEGGDPATATIRSSRGTIRGVKNRVRAGIATFLQMHSTKTWQEREAGKVVVYTTTMGIVRSTYQRCLKVRQILRTHLVKYEEKDVFMSRETQAEIKERMNLEEIIVPQVFIEGQYIGDAEVFERLNETGELRRILKPYKSPDACTTCQVCGGYRLLPCAVCNGSKKSVHRNHFTTELVALKCMNCDEVGLVKCYNC